MRIIAGTLKRKTILSVPGMTTRPTSDRLRESIFNILSTQVRMTRVLDLYAGTGALGLEALSRGAQRCVFVDNHKDALAVIKKNISACAMDHCSQVLSLDISRNLAGIHGKGQAFDLVFMDPPYGMNMISDTLVGLSASGLLENGACLVCEHALTDPLGALPELFTLTDQRRYGKTQVSFLFFGPSD